MKLKWSSLFVALVFGVVGIQSSAFAMGKKRVQKKNMDRRVENRVARDRGADPGEPGTPEQSFGTNGAVSIVIDPKSDHRVEKVLHQADGKILVLVTLYASTDADEEEHQTYLVRLNSDGTLDTDFSDGGIRSFAAFQESVDAPNFRFTEIKTSADGERIYLGGYSYFEGGDYEVAQVFTLDDDGNLDSPFFANYTAFGQQRVNAINIDEAGNLRVLAKVQFAEGFAFWGFKVFFQGTFDPESSVILNGIPEEITVRGAVYHQDGSNYALMNFPAGTPQNENLVVKFTKNFTYQSYAIAQHQDSNVRFTSFDVLNDGTLVAAGFMNGNGGENNRGAIISAFAPNGASRGNFVAPYSSSQRDERRGFVSMSIDNSTAAYLAYPIAGLPADISQAVVRVTGSGVDMGFGFGGGGILPLDGDAASNHFQIDISPVSSTVRAASSVACSGEEICVSRLVVTSLNR